MSTYSIGIFSVSWQPWGCKKNKQKLEWRCYGRLCRGIAKDHFDIGKNEIADDNA